MSEHKAFRCDGPDCEVTEMADQFGGLPEAWYRLYSVGRNQYWHFHKATCLRRFAEQLAPVMVGEREY